MANTPIKPAVTLQDWTTGQTRLNSANLTGGINTNLSNIKTAVDGVIDCIDDMQEELAPAYDATSTYEVGDLCTYQGGLYACSTAIPVAEAWDPSHWTATDVAEQFGSISASPMVETTWAELKALRDNGQLVPGMQYRITDYQCTTTQKATVSNITYSTASAGHQFDIIVTADSINTLNEVARAILHEGDTYFINSNLSAWKLWYSLDNDRSKFLWAKPIGFILNNDNNIYYRDPTQDSLSSAHPYCWSALINGTTLYYRYTDVENPTTSTIVYGTATGGTTFSISSITESGNGVIYRMIDEFNNDLPYDFKNILFTKSGSGQYAYSSVYTFSNRKGSSYYDASLNDFALGVSDGALCHSNTIRETMTAANSKIRKLNFTVFIKQSGDTAYGRFDCYSNYFGIGNEYNCIGRNFVRNTFGLNCHNNNIGSNFEDNKFGDNFSSNTLGNNGYGNTIGNNVYNNTMGDSFVQNYIKSYFTSNQIGDSFIRNSVGHYFQNNIVGTGFVENNVGNRFQYNTIGAQAVSTWVNSCTFDNNIKYIHLSSNDPNPAYNNIITNVVIHNKVGSVGSYSSSTLAEIVVPRNLDHVVEYYPAGSVREEI